MNPLEALVLCRKIDAGEMKPADWNRFAVYAARDAHDNNFESRRGIYPMDCDYLVIYNNNPYEKYPQLRDEEVKKLRAKLAELGIKELGFGTYPPPEETEEGELPDYTFAMILEAKEDRMQEVVTISEKILRESWEYIEAHPAKTVAHG